MGEKKAGMKSSMHLDLYGHHPMLSRDNSFYFIDEKNRLQGSSLFRGRVLPKIPVGERPSALRLIQAWLTWWQEAEQPSMWETRKLLQDDSRSWAWGPQTPRLPSHAVWGSPHHEACGP